MTAPLPADAPLGIYLHIPFCSRICPYCDFNTYAHQEQLIPDYVESLVGEMDLTLREIGPHPARTIYFGGGTPSLLAPEQVNRLVDAARARFPLPDDAEVSLEANPETVDAESLRGFREAGVTRISLGVQTQQRSGLKVLGRGHRPDVPGQALAAARAVGLDNLSVDFIFGWPGQALADWERDLDSILEWQPEHLSLYSLIVEPGTPYARAVRRGILVPPDEDATADMYERAIARLADAGWRHYEVSNWAREPRFASAHNLVYWRNGHYLGLGAGAHGHLGNVRASNVRLPAAYIREVRAGRLPVAEREVLDEATAMGETMMLGLRLPGEGISADAFAARHGRHLEEVYGRELADLARLGLVSWDGAHVRLTARGLMVANVVEERFLPEPTPPAAPASR
ncbi:MAG TPA: radical SAM family heme chaperone HemW [Thermomicrobiaceae bacterium]|nr:radical SAM family heme chaperone HemW [Thermomicrobiaceae bacterium]